MSNYTKTALTILAVTILAIYARYNLPVGAYYQFGMDYRDVVGLDLKQYFLPAAAAFLRGQSPYSIFGFVSPPWVMAIYAPLYYLPVEWAAALMFSASMMAFAWAGCKAGLKFPWVFVFPLASLTLVNSYFGNIDGFMALGLFMPPQIGLFFLLAKPQVGAAVALLWLWQTWKRGRLRECVRVFTPVSLAFLASFAVFGLWPLKMLELSGAWWNTSIFPYSVPFGLAFMALAFRRGSPVLAAAGGALLSPFLSHQTWVFVLLGILVILPGWDELRRFAHQVTFHDSNVSAAG